MLEPCRITLLANIAGAFTGLFSCAIATEFSLAQSTFWCPTSPPVQLLPFLVDPQSLNEGSRRGPNLIMAYSSAESHREMTNGAHPNTHPGGPGTSTLPRYLHKKQQRQKGMRSSSPMGRVILINSPVDGELLV